MGGGLASKSLQFTAEWSEIEGSMTSIFDTNLSSECVSNKSRVCGLSYE